MTTNRTHEHSLTLPRPGTYDVEISQSTISVRATHLFGLLPVTTRFRLRSARFVIGRRAEDSRVDAVVDADSLTSGDRRRDKQVRSRSLLNTREHPEVGYRSTTLQRDGAAWIVHGTLTVRGVDAPCDLRVTEIRETPEGLAVQANCTIDRYAHGLTGARGFVGRRVTATLSVLAE